MFIFQVATAGDSAGDPGFPERVPPSFCRLFVYWVFILLYSYLFFSIYLLHCIVYISLLYLLALLLVCLFVGMGCSMRDKPITQA